MAAKPVAVYRVVHVITGLGRGGAEGALYRLCSLQKGDDLTVVSLSGEGIYGERLRKLGVDVLALNMASPFSFIRALFELRRLLRTKQPDIVQTWMYHADLVGGLAAWSASFPVCWGIRNNVAALAGKWSTRLVAKLCACISGIVPSRIISCSRRAIGEHRLLGYSAPFEWIPNGFDFARWALSPAGLAKRAQFNLSSDAFVFAHAARAHPQKDHATLAAAFSLAFARNPALRLILCGDGLDEGSVYLESLPFSCDARNAVRVLGPRDDLPEIWKLADGFVLSSIVEGFPNVVAEAMASGLPCVVTDVGDAAEIVASTGCVVAPSDPAELARAMIELSVMPSDVRARLSEQAARRISANFTVERMDEAFRQVWDAVLTERQQACEGNIRKG